MAVSQFDSDSRCPVGRRISCGPGRAHRLEGTRSVAAILLATAWFISSHRVAVGQTTRAIGFPDLPLPARKAVPESVEDLRSIEKRVQSLLPLILPVVVAVDLGQSTGSGVVVSTDGYVLTAAHVSESANRDVRITFPDGKVVRGRTLGANHEIDAGLIKISESGPWPHVEMSKRDDLRLGDWVLTLGHPGGYEPLRPPVVRLGRILRLPSPMLQTDCTITAGDSGGPLFDLRGDVIGIHSRISDGTSDNFHAPIQAFHDSWERLVKGDKWGEDAPRERPSIGARGVDHPDGCKLELVEADGTAAKAGIQVGDIIHQIDSEPVQGSDGFRQRLRQSKPGDDLKLVLMRDGKQINLTVKVGTRKGRR